VFTVISVIWIVAVFTIFVTVAHDMNQQQNNGMPLLLAGLRGYLP
jgi:hypothetical protein